MKRIVYIIIGIVIIIAIALGAWWVFFRTPPTTQTGTQGATGTLPQTGTQSGNGGTGFSGGLGTGTGASSSSGASSSVAGINQTVVKSFGVLPIGPVFNYFVDPQNNITVVAPDGTISQVASGQSSQPVVLNPTAITDLISADFSYDGKKVLVSFGNINSPQASIFDIATKAWTPLPQGLVSPRWSPTDYRIAYFADTTTTASLATLDAANLKKAPVLLLALDTQDFVLTQWFSKSQFILAERPSAYIPGSVLMFDSSKNTVTPVVLNENGGEGLWVGATTGTSAYGITFSQNGPAGGHTLQLVNAVGGTLQTLSFATLPSKCLFAAQQLAPASSSAASSSTQAAATTTPSMALFCGIPRDTNTFYAAHLPDDYDQMALFTSDDLYMINVATGATDALLSDPTQNLDISNLKFFNQTIFFVNRYDQNLYAVTL